MANKGDKNLETHPILDKVLAEGGVTPKSITGYVGASSRGGYVTIYPNLTDLTKSYEVAVDDVLHTADVPESVRPFGAKVVWLRGDADVGFRRVQTGQSAASGPQGPTNVQSGRLNMQIPMMADGGRHCTCGECSVCVSHCDTECVSGGDCMYPPPVTL